MRINNSTYIIPGTIIIGTNKYSRCTSQSQKKCRSKAVRVSNSTSSSRPKKQELIEQMDGYRWGENIILSFRPSIHLSIYPSIHLSIYLSIYLCTYRYNGVFSSHVLLPTCRLKIEFLFHTSRVVNFCYFRRSKPPILFSPSVHIK